MSFPNSVDYTLEYLPKYSARIVLYIAQYAIKSTVQYVLVLRFLR